MIKYSLFLIFCAVSGFYAKASDLDTSRWASSSYRLNTSASESNPLLSADGQTMYFVRRNHAQNFGEDDRDDIWVSYRDSSGMWSNSVNIGAPLNNDQNNKVVGVSLSNETLYLTGDSNNQVFFSKNKNRTWSFPRALELPEIFNDANELNCHVSIDEQYILLSLRNTNSIGERDLFICKKDVNGKWQRPISLGAIINSPLDESNVFLSSDNKTLYFCTNGRTGLGGYDWFVSRRLDDTWSNWSTPANLGPDVNSESDDRYFCINTELEECYGVVRVSETDLDITRFILNNKDLLPTRMTLIYGKVQNLKGEPVQTIVDIQPLEETKPRASVFSKQDGRFLAMLDEQQRAGFYALDKNVFAAMAYTNLTDQPLKVLDNGSFHKLDSKDSLHQFNVESIQIRLNELESQISKLESNRPKSFKLDIVQIQKYLKQSSDFEVNQNIEKIRKNYNIKYGKKEGSSAVSPVFEDWKQPSGLSSYVPNAEDITHAVRTPEKVQLMKKGFEDQKKKKETGKIVESENKGVEEISKEEARRAIDELGQIHVNNQKAAPDFDVLLANVKNRIISDEFPGVKAGLERDLIWEWNGWKEMGFKPDEEKKIKSKVDEVQKKLKLYFEQRNRFEHAEESIDKVLYEDDKIIYDELRKSVINNMFSYMKDEIRKEIDFEMKYRLCLELKSALQKNLEKEKRLIKADATIGVNGIIEEAAIGEYNHSKNLIINIYPLSNEVTIPLAGIFFQANSDVLLPESNAELSRLMQLLESDPFRFLEISSHTHGYCSDEFADEITERRCQSIKRALVQLGADPLHIYTKGFGKKVPVVANNTIEGRMKNQRTEMKLLTK